MQETRFIREGKPPVEPWETWGVSEPFGSAGASPSPSRPMVSDNRRIVMTARYSLIPALSQRGAEKGDRGIDGLRADTGRTRNSGEE